MSLLNILTALERIHNAHGQLTEIRGHLQTFNRAANFNPRREDSWDILDLRDDRLTRINRAIRRARQTFRRLAGSSESIADRSDQVSSLCGEWAVAYADHGQGSRQEQRAAETVSNTLLQWLEDVGIHERNARRVREKLEKYRRFYEAQRVLFRDLKRIAERFVRYWPNTAQKAQALAYMIQFEQIEGSCSNIVRDIDAGLGRVSRWEAQIRESNGRLRRWTNWISNRRRAQSDIARNRVPV